MAASEDGAGWLGFLRGLTARGLTGVKLVVSDAHRGLVDAIAATLPGAGWQRCRTHYLRNLLTKVPRSAQAWVATMVRTIFDQPDAAAVRDQFARVIDAIQAKFPDAADHLDHARDDLLAFAGFPHEIWRQILDRRRAVGDRAGRLSAGGPARDHRAARRVAVLLTPGAVVQHEWWGTRAIRWEALRPEQPVRQARGRNLTLVVDRPDLVRSRGRHLPGRSGSDGFG